MSRARTFCLSGFLAVFFLLLAPGCGTDSKSTSGGDVIPPAAVSDLGVASSCDSSVLLVWTAPGDDDTVGTASSYDLRYSSRPDTLADWWDSLCTAADSVPTPRPAGGLESLLVRALDPDTIYYFGLRTSDEVPNWSVLSNVVQAACEEIPESDTVAPSVVTDLAVLYITSTSVTLTWTAPGNDGSSGTAASYDIRYALDTLDEECWDTAEPAPGIPAPQAALSPETLAVFGLLPDTTYGFGLRAGDESGNVSPLSNVAIARTPAFGDTLAPARIPYLYASARGSGRVFLAWIAPGDDGNVGRAAAYDIRHSAATIDEDTWPPATRALPAPVPSPAGTADSTTVLAVPPGWRFFALRAFDGAGNGSPISDDALVFVADYPYETIPPARIEDLSVTEVTDSTVGLQWTAPGDDGMEGTACAYDVRHSTAPLNEDSWATAIVSPGPPVPGPAGSSQSTAVRSLLPGTTYWFGVKSRDDVGLWSDLSNVVQATVAVDQTPPGTVADLHITSVAEASVRLSWTAPPEDRSIGGPSSEYDLRYSELPLSEANWDDAARWELTTPLPPGGEEDILVRDLEPGAGYFFGLRTADEVLNWSEISNIVTVTLTSLNVEPRTLDFGVSLDTAEVVVSNPGDGSITFQATADRDWLHVHPVSSTISARQQVVARVWVDWYEPGDPEGHLVFSSTRDADTVAVRMTRPEGLFFGRVFKIVDIWISWAHDPRFGYDTLGVEGAQVSCAGRSATTAADGGFQFEGIEPGTHLLSVRDDRYVPFDTTVTVSSGVFIAAYPEPIPEDYYPLQVGNRYTYHFSEREEHGMAYGSTGDEEWEITGRDIVDEDTVYTVQVTGQAVTWPWVDTLEIETTRAIRQSGNRITIDVPKMDWEYVLCRRYYPAYSPEVLEVVTGRDYYGSDFDMWMRRGVGPSRWRAWGGHASDHWDYTWELTDWTIAGKAARRE